MSDVMLAQTTSANNPAPVKSPSPRGSQAGKESSEISESSGSFSNMLKGQAETREASAAQAERVQSETEAADEALLAETNVAADGKGLPAELLEGLPDELVDLLESLPDEVMEAVVAQFNGATNPEMAIPAQQKLLVKEIQAALRQYPDLYKLAADAFKALPEVLNTAEQKVSQQGQEQLAQVKQLLAEASERIQSQARSAFQQLAAQIVRPNVEQSIKPGERPVLPDAALAALNNVQTETLQTQATQRATPATQLHTPFKQAGWDNELSERIVWMANQKLQRADIKMNPPQLGPIEVRLNISGDQAQVQFTAQHAVVRDALEAALPRLREMFNASGLNLADVNVSDQGAEQRRSADASGEGKTQGAFNNQLQDADDETDTVTGVNLLNTSTPLGAIDYFV